MNDLKTNDVLNEINNLLQLLLPEINAFKALAKDMAKIDSPYQSDFNYLKILLSVKNQDNDIQKNITSIVEELNHFSSILNKISKDNDVIELYSKDGLLEKCANLQKSMEKRLGSI